MSLLRAGVLALAGCVLASSSASGQTSAVRHLRNWVLCVECVNGELDSVRAVFLRQPQPTTAWFQRLLLTGPPPEWVRRYQHELHARFTEDSLYALRDTAAAIDGTRAEFVEWYGRTFVLGIRARAAIALASMGGIPSRIALDSALAIQLPPVLRVTVRMARDSLWHP